MRKLIARGVPLLMLLLTAVAATALLRRHLGIEILHDNHVALIDFRDENYVLAVVAFIAAFILLVLSSLPASIAMVGGGFLFGLFPGVVYSVIAGTVGATLLFLMVRSGAGTFFTRRLDTGSGALCRMRNAIRENEIPVLLLMRLVPAVPFVVANVLPALVGVRTERFVVTTLVGMIPSTLAFTWVGTELGEVIAQGEVPDLSMLRQPYIIVPLAAICLLVALSIVVKFWRKGGSA